MSTAVKKTRKKTAYETHFDVRKKLMLWVPPLVEQAYFDDYLDDPDSPTIMNLVYLIEADGIIERIDTMPYHDSFQTFYDLHLNKYNEDKTNFCAKYSEGGVSPEYIINSANCKYKDKNVTLISLELDEYENIKDVYGLITFHLLEHDPETIMVETLCGNRTLPPSGEGTRLMNFLKRRAYEVGIKNIALHPLENVIEYYKKLNFRKLNSDEADAVNLSDEEDETMGINLPANKNWNKLRTTVKVLGTFLKNKKLKDTRKRQKVIKEIYKAKYDEKTGKRGTPIHKPFSQPTTHFVPQPSKVGKVVDVKTSDGITVRTKLATPIIPGASMQLIKERDAILTAAKITKLRNEAAQKKLSTASPINEESSEEEPLTESQIKELARQFKLEEEKNGFTVFQNAKKTAKGTRKRKHKRRV